MTQSCSRCRVVAALVVAALAAGCASSPPPALFTLVPQPGPVLDTPVGAVAVRNVEIAKYLDRPQIVRFRTSYEIMVSDFERWDEALNSMATRVLVEDLSLRLPAGTVTVAASTVSPKSRPASRSILRASIPSPTGPRSSRHAGQSCATAPPPRSGWSASLSLRPHPPPPTSSRL